MNKQKTLKIVKLVLTALAAALLLYLTYAIIAQFVAWSIQPEFVSLSSGKTTSSMGFLIQNFIFMGFFVLDAAALALMSTFFFILPAKRKKKAAGQQKAA